jgi:hypothetical protein
MNELLSGIIGGAVSLGLMAILWSQTNSKIDGKLDREVYEERRKSLDDKLATIRDEIHEIRTSQEKLTSTVMEFIGQRRHESEE